MKILKNNSFVKTCELQIYSSRFIEETRKLSIYLALFIILIGLIGNSLGFVMFLQKKMRSKSTSIYLLFLIISDSLYLITHFFEDTLRAHIDHYIYKTKYVHEACFLFIPGNETKDFDESELTQSFASFINIMDRFDFFCRSINFARYFLRFMSAYIIVAFTIQRTRAIRKPFMQKMFESKRNLAWIFTTITISAILSSLWIPMILHSKQLESNNYISQSECYIREGYSNIYFAITNTYIVIIMFIPMIVICACNSLTIYYLKKSSRSRKALSEESNTFSRSQHSRKSQYSRKTQYFSINLENLNTKKTYNEQIQVESTKTNTILETKRRKNLRQETKANIMLLVMSFSYVLLDLPYFISWVCLFYHGKNQQLNQELKSIIDYSTFKNFLIGITHLTELLYLLNFSIHFYIYCISSKTYYTRLKKILICNSSNEVSLKL